MPLILLVLYIIIEIALFIWIGGIIGVGWTLLWVLAGFIIGVWMLRRGGSESRKWLERASRGNNIGEDLKGAGKQIYWYVGGLLVILPGFFTDLLGFMLVFPPTQKLVTWIGSLFVPEFLQTGVTVATNFSSQRQNTDEKVIEGEAIEISKVEGSNPPQN